MCEMCANNSLHVMFNDDNMTWPPNQTCSDLTRSAQLRPRRYLHLHLVPQVIILTLLYSWAGLGIAIVNDFKSVEGDREMGLQSLPVAFGVEKAKWICVASIDATQLGIAAWLYSIGEPTYAAVLTALVLPQIFAQFKYFLPDPVGNDVK